MSVKEMGSVEHVIPWTNGQKQVLKPTGCDRSETRASTEGLFVSVLVHHVGHCKFGELLSVFKLGNKI